MCIRDSLALLWNQYSGESVKRHSGLKFIKALVESARFQKNTRQLWVMPSGDDRKACQIYLESLGIDLPDTAFYEAPYYSDPEVTDSQLLDQIRTERPDYVILAIAGGKQEILGHWLTKRLDYEPTIVCIGAAIAFLTGRQATIPDWADRIYIGWLLRILSNPGTFLPRYWNARTLKALIKQWGPECPEPK